MRRIDRSWARRRASRTRRFDGRRRRRRRWRRWRDWRRRRRTTPRRRRRRSSAASSRSARRARTPLSPRRGPTPRGARTGAAPRTAADARLWALLSGTAAEACRIATTPPSEETRRALVDAVVRAGVPSIYRVHSGGSGRRALFTTEATRDAPAARHPVASVRRARSRRRRDGGGVRRRRRRRREPRRRRARRRRRRVRRRRVRRRRGRRLRSGGGDGGGDGRRRRRRRDDRDSELVDAVVSRLVSDATVEYGARVAGARCLASVARACSLASDASFIDAAAEDLAATATKPLLTHVCSARLGGGEAAGRRRSEAAGRRADSDRSTRAETARLQTRLRWRISARRRAARSWTRVWTRSRRSWRRVPRARGPRSGLTTALRFGSRVSRAIASRRVAPPRGVSSRTPRVPARVPPRVSSRGCGPRRRPRRRASRSTRRGAGGASGGVSFRRVVPLLRRRRRRRRGRRGTPLHAAPGRRAAAQPSRRVERLGERVRRVRGANGTARARIRVRLCASNDALGGVRADGVRPGGGGGAATRRGGGAPRCREARPGRRRRRHGAETGRRARG